MIDPLITSTKIAIKSIITNHFAFLFRKKCCIATNATNATNKRTSGILARSMIPELQIIASFNEPEKAQKRYKERWQKGYVFFQMRD